MYDSALSHRRSLLFAMCTVAIMAVFATVFLSGTAYALEGETATDGTQAVALTAQDTASDVVADTGAAAPAQASEGVAGAANVTLQATEQAAGGEAAQPVSEEPVLVVQTEPESTPESTPESEVTPSPEESVTVEEPVEEETVELPYEEAHVNMYRLYNPNSGEHFYTSSIEEATSVASVGWRWEGIGWVAPIENSSPVYRLYNPNAGDHHYTLDEAERDGLVALGWNFEGIGWYSDANTQLPVYRQYNPNAVAGAHNFTTSADEDVQLGNVGWSREGVSWYATDGPTIKIAGRWLVTAAWGSLERYWIDSNGTIATSRFITPEEGAGYTAYATPSGAVVRGKYDRGDGYVYVADADGRLAATSDGADGWLVTDAYDGAFQRYYYVAAERAFKSGFFDMDGAKYFGIGGQGYVLRGHTGWGNHVLLADNDGKMATGTGWRVSDAYDGALQRYFLETVWSDFSGAKTGFFDVDGNKYYGSPEHGYVTRNGYARDGSTWYWANNDGVLTVTAPPAEWVMTEKAQGYSSSTGYLMLIDNDSCHVGVFTGSQGNWTLLHYWDCANGRDDSPTVRGVYYMGSKGYSFGDDDHTCFYYSQISGNYLFHSVLYEPYQSSPRDDNVKFAGLGGHFSNGCVRLATENAHWVYSNVPSGTTIVSYN